MVECRRQHHRWARGFLMPVVYIQVKESGRSGPGTTRNYRLTGIPQMASRGCRRWQHKGRASTNPALNRYGRSRSTLYRADMAMGNPAQWSFHALRVQRPLWVKSRPFATTLKMSAFGGIADIILPPLEEFGNPVFLRKEKDHVHLRK